MKMTDRYTCICLTCLSRDTKMCSILNTPLPKFYEKLANIQVSVNFPCPSSVFSYLPISIYYFSYQKMKYPKQYAISVTPSYRNAIISWKCHRKQERS